MAKTDVINQLLRDLPSVDAVLKTEAALTLAGDLGTARLSALARQVTDELRNELLAGSAPDSTVARGGHSRQDLLMEAQRRLSQLHHREKTSGLHRVINATGVILHTNLGRAPLSEAARAAVLAASGYCSLEYDIVEGARGRRGGRVEDLLLNLTGAEAAIVVNNCAAAALLVLSTLARDGETIVSRGELVEIGGDFRVPDVMAQSGTRMIEIGTTNRTRLADYANAISSHTRLVMRVHTSNYRIVGFTKTPALSELADLAHNAGLPLYEDAGSGALIDLGPSGITGEPLIRESLEAGADVVTFSGDKLLGGPQSGVIVGQAALIERMRSNPLYRALRADKLRLAGLEATLEEYARGETVPTLAFIGMTAEEIGERADKLIGNISKLVSESIKLEKIAGESAVGGGSAPTSPLPTFLISVSSPMRSANEIEHVLRRSDPPIIARIEADRVLIDLRTVREDEEPQIEVALASLS